MHLPWPTNIFYVLEARFSWLHSFFNWSHNSERDSSSHWCQLLKWPHALFMVAQFNTRSYVPFNRVPTLYMYILYIHLFGEETHQNLLSNSWSVVFTHIPFPWELYLNHELFPCHPFVAVETILFKQWGFKVSQRASCLKFCGMASHDRLDHPSRIVSFVYWPLVYSSRTDPQYILLGSGRHCFPPKDQSFSFHDPLNGLDKFWALASLAIFPYWIHPREENNQTFEITDGGRQWPVKLPYIHSQRQRIHLPSTLCFFLPFLFAFSAQALKLLFNKQIVQNSGVSLHFP